MPAAVQSAIRNRLLGFLAPADFEWVAPRLQFMELGVRHTLAEPDQPIEAVYFIESGLASVLARNTDSRQIEVGHIGWEGMTGTPLVLGVEHSPAICFMQIPGSGWRLSALDLAEAMSELEGVARVLRRFLQAFHTQVTHTALANGRYTIQQRLARWLLMCHDRVDDTDLQLTHEFLATMLGVRRSGVTSELHVLEGQRFIRASRKNISILDRAALERLAGGSYGLPEREYERIFAKADR